MTLITLHKYKQVWILCNDCGAEGEVQFHVVAHKCLDCNSYNTKQTIGRRPTASCSSTTVPEIVSQTFLPKEDPKKKFSIRPLLEQDLFSYRLYSYVVEFYQEILGLTRHDVVSLPITIRCIASIKMSSKNLMVIIGELTIVRLLHLIGFGHMVLHHSTCHVCIQKFCWTYMV